MSDQAGSDLDPLHAEKVLNDTETRVAVAGHPIHAMLVAFPIALTFCTLGADLFYWWTGDGFWTRVALWAIGAAFLMGLLGATPLAAHAIAIQIASLTFMVPLGIGQAGTVRVGRAFGAGDRDGVRLAGAVALALGLGFMVLTALMMLAVPGLLVAPFLDQTRPGAAEVAQLAVTFLLFAAIFQLADGAQVVGSSILRGLGDTRVPMIFAGLGYWVIGLPLSAALGFLTPLAGRGIWIGLAIALTVVAVLMLGRWFARERLGLMRSLDRVEF